MVAVAPAFSSVSESYDAHSHVQRYCAAQLNDWMPSEPVHSVLDVGCGTGRWTKELADTLRADRVLGLDRSEAMIHTATRSHASPIIDYQVGDINTTSLSATFDLIVSNATLHWSENLSESVSRLSSLMASPGRLLASLFGPQTFQELATILDEHSPSRSIPAQSFRAAPEIHSIFSDHLDSVELVQEHRRVRYPSVTALLREIQLTGVAPPSSQGLWTPRRLTQIDSDYRARFGDIWVTYHLFFVRGSRA